MPVKAKTRVKVKPVTKEEAYKLSPKAIFALALEHAQLSAGLSDSRVEQAWTRFVSDMERFGYIHES